MYTSTNIITQQLFQKYCRYYILKWLILQKREGKPTLYRNPTDILPQLSKHNRVVPEMYLFIIKPLTLPSVG